MHKLSYLKSQIIVKDYTIGNEMVYRAFCPLGCGHSDESTSARSISGRSITIGKIVAHLKIDHLGEFLDDTLRAADA